MAAAATKTRIKQGSEPTPVMAGHGAPLRCGRRGLQQRVHCLSGFIIGAAQRICSTCRSRGSEANWMRGQLTDCTLRSVCVRDFSSTFFPSTLEPNRAKGGWQQRNVLHSNFLQKKLHFFATAVVVVVVLFFLCGCMSKWQQGGWGNCVCIQLLSIAQCGGCYRRGGAGRQTGGGAGVERVPNSK